jgi:riboflavin biosynthesis pyrimidine reductase
MRELIWVMQTEANQQERLLRRQLDHEVAILPEIFHATIGLRSALSVLNMRRFASLL